MSTRIKTWVGAAIWLGYILIQKPVPRGEGWSHAVLLLAALVLVPLALDLVWVDDEYNRLARLPRWTRAAQLPAALLLALSCALSAGGLAAVAASPWVAFCGLVAISGCLQATQEGGRRPLDRLTGDIAMIFLGVGGAWVFADRAGFRPLDFPPAIVALTAVHFHFAGLLLPLCAGLAVRQLPNARLPAVIAVAVVLGVPAVALGITSSQMGWGPLVETVAGCSLALAGLGVAWLHLRLAGNGAFPMSGRVLLLLAGASLAFGMSLAALYALRAFAWPLPWLDLPWMRALHGTANAFGFGLGGMLAWRLIGRTNVAP